MDKLTDAAKDLLLGSSCVGCARPGRLLCPDCLGELPVDAVPAWPTPTPAGLVEPWAAGEYADTLRALVLGHKERDLLSLAPVLGRLLAQAVVAETRARDGPLLLVPVPSAPRTVRQRGHDPTLSITAAAASVLRRAGPEVRVARLLRQRRRVADQSGLDAGARAANLHGSMQVHRRTARRVLRWGAAWGAVWGVPRVVVCDDVLTTGSTAREAQRALETSGWEVVRVAVVAATRRRHPGGPEVDARRPEAHGSFSVDLLS